MSNNLIEELFKARKELFELRAENENLKDQLAEAKEVLNFYASLSFKPTHACDMDIRFQIDGGDMARAFLEKSK